MNSLSTTMKAFPNNGKCLDYKNYFEQIFYPPLESMSYLGFYSWFSSKCTLALLLH